jgi:hypothetical protein
MVQGTRGARFAFEALERLGVFGKCFREEFQGDQAAELGVLGFIDNTHPAPDQLLEDVVMRNRLANHRRTLLSVDILDWVCCRVNARR